MMRNIFLAAMGLVFFISCKNDDDNTVEIEVRDRGEVQVESSANLSAYLDTHFYNYEEFETPPADFDYKIRFDTISGDNADKTPLSSQVITRQYTFEETEYELYILKVREGEGVQPTFADSTFLNYEGRVVGGNRFDVAISPVWFDLSQVVFGFANGVSELKAGTQFTQNADGTFDFGSDYGIGAVFIPSGLGYFNGSGPGFGSYSDLVFTFDLFRAVEDTDNDRDGVPNWMEDVNGNNYVNELGDDTDGDRVPNYLDTDDDGDGTPTREEINLDEDGNLVLPFPDTDNDGTPDYLDPEIS